MEHITTLEYHGQYLARPWAVTCSCGYKGACATEEEAKQTAEHHRKRWSRPEGKHEASKT